MEDQKVAEITEPPLPVLEGQAKVIKKPRFVVLGIVYFCVGITLIGFAFLPVFQFLPAFRGSNHLLLPLSAFVFCAFGVWVSCREALGLEVFGRRKSST